MTRAVCNIGITAIFTFTFNEPVTLNLTEGEKLGSGLFGVAAVRFQNVGNNDFNEGARNYVAIRLCVGRWV